MPLDPSPKGSLEELFRHHLLESEAAAVPPLPHVWEQVDNSLLLLQNKQYRRRLRTYRWAMAASLLLAALAGGGWWQSQQRRPAGSLAVAGPSAHANEVALATRLPSGSDPLGLLSNSSLTNLSAIGQTSTFTTPLAFAFSAQSLAASTRGLALATAADGRGSQAGSVPRLGLGSRATTAYLDDDYGFAGVGAPDAGLATPDQPGAADADQLGARLASLRLPAADALPAQLATTPLTRLNAPKSTRPWQLQVAYAAGMFDPNIDFTKSPNSYNANLGPGTVATTREAAAEYRSNLRNGLGQRLSVWATRRLGIGRWSLRSGLELSQNEASSASSVAFVGEQVSTLTSYVQVLPNRLQTTTYRYRSASVPVEAVYHSPLRHGFSLYGRAGALFSALLHVRSEVDGDPEAERSYSLKSVGSPYRHLSASVRGGVGVRYQPTGQAWTFSLGPVAETGVTSLNIAPSQTFWKQQRPYSIGLEAGMEFGSWLKPAPVILP